MFSGLRLRLTVLYLLAGATLIALIGGGMYVMVRRYFQSTTDHALEHRMAFEFIQLGAPLPAALSSAELEVIDLSRDAQSRAGLELAEIFVLPLDEQGRALFNPNPFPPPIAADAAAARQALAAGSDWRTLELANGSRVRLLSYRLTRDDGPRVMQAGRMLDEQDQALGRFLLALLALGAGSLVLLGWGSWWLAGSSIVPAQRAWERQQAFVANASHELRAPLTLLRASAEVALRGTPAGDEDQRELLGDVLHECDHMTRLVEDLLLLSRLDAGQLQLARAPVAAADLLDEVARQIGRLAAERGVALAIDAAPVSLCGDQVRVRQVLLILLDNALRHTPAGGSIAVRASAAGRETEIVVSDTGAGIPAEHLPHLFERFYRADSSRHDEQRGSGLGLSIARALVQAQGGRISLSSAPGAGTEARIVLPAA